MKKFYKKKSFDYDFFDISEALEKLNLNFGDTIYITGDLFKLGRYNRRDSILNDLYKLIINKIGKRGTICFPTHSWKLLNSNSIFIPNQTKSETGAFTEFLRKKKSVRQDHPYSSVSSIGKFSDYICKNNSRSVYGKKSPFEKLIKLNAKIINFGLHPRFCCSSVHHSELLANVPYRYKKFFYQKVFDKKKIIKKKYSLFVLKEKYLNTKRNKNKIIFNHFQKKNIILKSKLGRDYIYAYSLTDFHKNNISLFKTNKFAWLGYKPKKI